MNNIEFNMDTAFESLGKISLPRWDDLPDIDLYMDQVIVIMDKFLCRANLQLATGDATDKILTSSMVNNYVKKGYMPPPYKKRYNREHLAHLYIICVMKQTLPIAMVDKFIKSMLEVMDISVLMDVFTDNYEACFVSSVEEMHATYNDMQESLGKGLPPKSIMAVRATAFANSGKIVAEIVNDSMENN